MNQNIPIRLLEAKSSQVHHLLRTEQDLSATDREDAHLLVEVISCVIRNTQRAEVEQRDGTLADLNDLKYGVRLAGLLLQNAQEREPDAIRGWRFGAPQNDLQTGYDFVYELAMGLAFSVISIERQYPQHSAYFAQERADYVRACEPEINGQPPQV